MTSLRRSSSIALAVGVATLLMGAPAAAATYPSPPPDFAHPDSPHAAAVDRPTFSPQTGSPIGPRPLLVIYVPFSDFPNPSADAIQKRFFAAPPDGCVPVALGCRETDGSIRDYFWEASGGDFLLNPAKETSGQHDDGVVAVNLGSFNEYEARSAEERTGTALNAVDPFIDFSAFDSNDDGRVAGDELAVTLIKTHTNPAVAGCGVIRPVPAGKTLDDKALRFTVAEVNTTTNQMTIAHELGHQTLGVEDLYFEGHGNTALGGDTCTLDNTNYWRLPNAYERLHWGWVNQPDPLVVTRDGYHELAAGSGFPFSAPAARILYDPDKGTDHYFMVEYRRERAGSYDEGVSDTGLFVWRVHDSRWPPTADPNDLPVNALVRPDPTKSGKGLDAWDPADTDLLGAQKTPQRTMSASWDDGTPSNVAVRAIPAATGESMRVYLDVRGPGVLVDPTDAKGQPLKFDTPLAGTTEIALPVMNTGETTDTFTFGVKDGDIPNATETTQTLTLAPREQATARVKLTLPADLGGIGPRSARVVGKSTTNPSVETLAPFTANVVKRTTTLAYTGDPSADYSDAALVSARLTDGATGAGIEGKDVKFTIGSQSATFTTSADGTASGEIVIDQPAKSPAVSASFAGDATYQAASKLTPFTINKESLSLKYTGSTLVSALTAPQLSVTGTEEADGRAGERSRATISYSLAPTLTATPYSFGAPMSPDGTSSVLAEHLPVDLWTLTARVATDNQYWESSATSPTELVVYDPAALMTADAGGLDSAGAKITANFSAQYDDSGPKGFANVKFFGGSFAGKQLEWIVQVGNKAIFQVRGALNRNASVLRMRALDAGEPGSADTFQAVLPSYDSGVVTVSSGNVKSH